MCLTPEAYRNRKWGRFPALRKALEDKQVPSNYYGLTTAEDNMFDAMGRLTEIAVLAGEYEAEIRETIVYTGREPMYDDLRKLEKDLEEVSHFFKTAADKVQGLYANL